MRILKTVALVVAVVMVLGMVACSSGGSSAVDKLGVVMDDVLKIVKSNSDKPAAAAAALEKYMKANGVKLAALQKDIEKETEVIKKDPSKLGDFMKKFAPLMKKGMELQKLSAELMKNAEFAKAMAAFQAASSGK